MAYIGKSPSTGIRNRFIYTATAGQTSFSGSDDHSRTLSYTDAEFMDVFLNGVKLDKSDYTATSGTSVVLDEGAAVDDILEVVAYDTFSVFNGEFSADVTVGGTLTANGNVDVNGNEIILDADGDTSITADTDDQIDFKTGGTDRIVIDAGGDIEFYEDTGTNVRWQWDASSEAVYVGLDEWPTSYIGKSANRHGITPDGAPVLLLWDASTGASGNNAQLWLGGKPTNSATNFAGGRIQGQVENNSDDDGFLSFSTSRAGSGMSEVMRIDSSGHLNVARTGYTSISTDGFHANASGWAHISTSGEQALYVNRNTSDGTIVQFSRDGTTVGSIGGGSTFLTIGGSSTFLFFQSNVIGPCGSSSGASKDNQIDLGSSSTRWRDIYTVGAVNTSDQNEKQQIASLTDAEIAAAKRISALFKTFKWNDAVAEKGDNARTHAGVIAQDVKAALVAEGLDAGDYAFWCSNTWWEADEAYTDDDGNAQTRTNTYDTQADAPDGATERTLQSVRYNELLAFVGAATEQRLADLETAKADFETRIAALEAN